jgi:hypothetical protein
MSETTKPTPVQPAEDLAAIASKLINKLNVKKTVLALAGARKDINFERVSGELFTELNDKVHELLKSHVAAHPAVGKTVFGFKRQAAEADPEPAAAPATAPTATA